LRLAILPLLVLAPPAPIQPPTPVQAPTTVAGGSTFPSAVELVRVDLVVTDKAGRPVSGLTKGDFVLSEGGVPQPITTFESVSVADAPEEEAPAEAPFASTNVGPEPRRARTFVVLFDDIHLTPTQAHNAKGAVAEFLRKGTGAGDRVTLIASGGGAWWNARMPEGREQLMGILKRLDGRYISDSSPDRMTEFEAMRIEVYQDQDVALRVQRRFDAYGTKGREQGQNQVSREDLGKSSLTGIIDMDVRSRAAEAYRLANSRNKITLEVMARALTALAGTPGRKAMVLVSQGFVFDTELSEMKKVVEASLRSNAPIYFVDTRGLQGLPESFTAAFGPPIDSQDTVAVLADITRDAEGTESLALDSGGFVVKNSNDLAGGIQRVSSESRTYYLLGYNPSDTRRDGKFRKIEVKLVTKRPGLKVRARRGYYAPQDGGAKPPTPQTDPVVAHALDSPFEVREVPLRVAAYSFDEALRDKINVVLATEIDVRDLHFREEGGRFKDEIAFLIEAQHRDSGEYFHFDEKIEMSLLPETKRKLESSWYAVTRDLVLPPGGYQAKVVVRDLGADGSKVGSVLHDFEVPAAAGFRISTPILTDAVDNAGGTASPRPVILVRRSFAPLSVLYCQFGVYGAASDPTTHMPRVSSTYEIRRADGTLLKRSARTAITPTSLGALLRLQGISLPPAEPGNYELRLSVRDEVANRLLNVQEDFMIEPPVTRKADR
jgi:VWFA-related protein